MDSESIRRNFLPGEKVGEWITFVRRIFGVDGMKGTERIARRLGSGWRGVFSKLFPDILSTNWDKPFRFYY